MWTTEVIKEAVARVCSPSRYSETAEQYLQSLQLPSSEINLVLAFAVGVKDYMTPVAASFTR